MRRSGSLLGLVMGAMLGAGCLLKPNPAYRDLAGTEDMAGRADLAGGVDLAGGADLAVAPPDLPEVLVRGGTFTMGSGVTEGQLNERPSHSETVTTFYLDASEVTVAAYKDCVDKTPCMAPGTGTSCNYGQAGKEGHPVNCVDWAQASAYCTARGRRLPTESEWEYAARGTRISKYPWGDDTPAAQLCWNRPGAGTCAAGSQGAKTLLGETRTDGVVDLGGNVREWTASNLCAYSVAGPINCDTAQRVVRGGAWSQNDAQLVRAAVRDGMPTAIRSNVVGFRCARDP